MFEVELQKYWTYVLMTISGLMLGKLIDRGCRVVRDCFDERLIRRFSNLKWISVVAQVMIICSVPVAFAKFGFMKFVQSWQITIGGLLFASSFLSMQTTLMSTAQG